MKENVMKILKKELINAEDDFNRAKLGKGKFIKEYRNKYNEIIECIEWIKKL